MAAYFLLVLGIVAIDLQRRTLLSQATTNLPFSFLFFFLSFFSFSCFSPRARTSLRLLCLQKMLPPLARSPGTYPRSNLWLQRLSLPVNLGQHGGFWRCVEPFARPGLRCCWLTGFPGGAGMVVLPCRKTSLHAFRHPGLALPPRHGWRNARLPAAGRRGTVARYFNCITFRWLLHLF